MFTARLAPVDDLPPPIRLLDFLSVLADQTPHPVENRASWPAQTSLDASQTGLGMASACTLSIHARTRPIAAISFLTLKAVHAHSHSVRTFSNPRNKN